jgi:hypothetical protein
MLNFRSLFQMRTSLSRANNSIKPLLQWISSAISNYAATLICFLMFNEMMRQWLKPIFKWVYVWVIILQQVLFSHKLSVPTNHPSLTCILLGHGRYNSFIHSLILSCHSSFLIFEVTFNTVSSQQYLDIILPKSAYIVYIDSKLGNDESTVCFCKGYSPIVLNNIQSMLEFCYYDTISHHRSTYDVFNPKHPIKYKYTLQGAQWQPVFLPKFLGDNLLNFSYYFMFLMHRHTYADYYYHNLGC